MYHFRPELTVDLQSAKRPVVNGGGLQPTAPLYFRDDWWRMKKDRPWFHVRYHSTSPLKPRDFPPHHLSPPGEGPRYLTLHLFFLHSFDDTDVPTELTYLLPHETYELERRPKVFAMCLEVSDSRDHPQTVAPLYEAQWITRKILKRLRAEEVTRRDFVTDEPLDALIQGDLLSVELPDLLFREVEVQETRRERTIRSWAERKAELTSGAAT